MAQGVATEVGGTARLRAWLLSDSPESTFHARCQRFYLGWRAFRANPIAMIGLAIITALVLTAVFAPLLTQGDGSEQHLSDRLLAPSAEHWFGTDELGRDIYERIVWGSRVTLYIVGLVGILVVPIGLLIGTVAGYVGGWVDTVLMRLTSSQNHSSMTGGHHQAEFRFSFSRDCLTSPGVCRGSTGGVGTRPG